MVKTLGVEYHMAMQAALAIPEALAIFLRAEPTTVKQAKASPERPRWNGAIETGMDGPGRRRVG